MANKKCSLGRGRKGVSPLLATVILVMITVVVSTMVSGFITGVSEERSKRIQNLTQARLACQYASLYVTNVTFDCNNNCFTGSPYRINATLQNPGSASLSISTMSVSLDNGESYIISVNSTPLSSGSVELKNFNNIIVNSSPLMPIGTMDHRNAYVNDTNTLALWHLDDGSGSSAVDSAGGNTGTVTGATWNASGRFGYGLTFDGINDIVSPSTTGSIGLSNSTATIEAWINMNSLGFANNYTIFSTPSQMGSSYAGLRGLWHFEENSTGANGVIDASGNGNHGTATNTPYFNSSGRFGNSWSFDGSNDRIDLGIPASLNLTTSDFSITAWIKTTQTSEQHIMSRGSGGMADSAVFRMTGGLNFRVSNSNQVTSAQSVSNNNWHYVAAVADRDGNAVVYIDGVQAGVGDISGSSGNSINYANGWDIGTEADGVGNFFRGDIDEIAIWNRALSAQEIRDLYLGGLSLHKQDDNLRFVAGNVTLVYNASTWSGWHHVAGTTTSTSATLYVDGNQVNATTNRGLAVLGGNSFIGSANGSLIYNLTFNGTIDEVRISNTTRNFIATLNFTASHPNIRFVRVFNQSSQMENASANLNGASYYSGQISVNTAADYRIEVEDTTGSKIEKWYPYRQGGSCKKTTKLDKIVFSTNNCPDTSDTYYGSDVTFVNCM